MMTKDQLIPQYSIQTLIIMSENMTVTEDREKIIEIYKTNVHGKKPDTKNFNQRHDGKQGHWLEDAIGSKRDASNAPDLFGFEIKNHTRQKVTFGDWSPNYWIFADKDYRITRDDFLKIFGKPNEAKNNRLSWSGEPIPNIKGTNSFGVKIIITKNNDISFVYSYSKDQRSNKSSLVPKKMQTEDLTIAKWNGSGQKSLKEKVEKKFNVKGWAKCSQDSEGRYDSIGFGSPMSFETWIGHVKTGEIYYDSGMYQGNSRNYCQWRASNTFWNNRIVHRYPKL